MVETLLESVVGHTCVCNESEVGVDTGVTVRRRDTKSGYDC